MTSVLSCDSVQVMLAVFCMRCDLKHLFCLVFVGIAITSPSFSVAQAFDEKQLMLIRDTAADICNTVSSTSGGTTRVQAEGSVSAELEGIFRRLADAGVDTALKISTEQYDNISREAVAAGVESDARCRERIFRMMFLELTTLKQQTSLGPPTYIAWRSESPVYVEEDELEVHCPCLAIFRTPTAEYSGIPANNLVVRNDCSGNALIWGRRDQGRLIANPNFQGGVPRFSTPDSSSTGTVTFSHQHERKEYIYENLRPGEVVFFDNSLPDSPFARLLLTPIQC